MHIGLLPRIHAARFPEKMAARDPRRSVTYEALERRANRLARGLLSLNVRKGDLVGIVLGNRVEHLEAAFAVAKAGAVGVPIDPAGTAAEFSRLAVFFGVSTFVVEEAAAENLLRSLEGEGNGGAGGRGADAFNLVVVGDRTQDAGLRYEDLIEREEDSPPEVTVSERDPFMVMLTSGTTGTPKGCVVSHGAYLYRCISYSAEFKMGSDELEVVGLPLFLGAGRGSTFACLALGASVILEPRFDPVRFLDIVTREKVTTFSLVPTAFQSLVDAVDSVDFDGSALRSMRNTGSSIPMDLRREIRGKISPNLYQTYASVDTGIMTVLRPEEMEGDPTRAGRAIWGMELKIADPNGRDLPAGEIGEIVCRGPLASDGYYRNPEAASAAFFGEWFRTGDVGCVDREGYVYVRGRIKNLIKSGGRSIFPDEIEAALLAHPHVREAAVFGVPDPKWGEAVHAAVAPKRGETLLPEDLLEHCAAQLSRFKRPKRIHVMAGLPRGNLGKVSIETLKKSVDPEG